MPLSTDEIAFLSMFLTLAVCMSALTLLAMRGQLKFFYTIPVVVVSVAFFTSLLNVNPSINPVLIGLVLGYLLGKLLLGGMRH